MSCYATDKVIEVGIATDADRKRFVKHPASSITAGAMHVRWRYPDVRIMFAMLLTLLLKIWTNINISSCL